MDALFSAIRQHRLSAAGSQSKKFGGPIEPASRPGSFSYTVIATTSEGKVVVQFRDKRSPLTRRRLSSSVSHTMGCFRLTNSLGTLVSLRCIRCLTKLQGDPYSTIFNYFIDGPREQVI